ncbi:hypothetical protein SD71_20985 [Cohnella kolymensis]|uniref:DUF421 domain-containing protein n=1 Tax=Cohnella kolymensis TaxID=1590652 RepID=A0ABR5A0K0_9BACL|nr:DUF421 domain-containing protein [Cohnella kolymensis]KIL34158.1 hypothetical protein SD71_20985 [Cohnella kolymensis]
MHLYAKVIISFFFLLLLTRIMGKKQMSQLTHFNYITGITLGSLSASVITEKHIPLYQGLLAVGIWSGLTLLLGFISTKSRSVKRMIDGAPMILIRHGRVDQKALASTKITIDDMILLLRQKDVFSVSEVDLAILESNGSISIYKKQEQTPAAKYIPTQIVADGQALKKNLNELGLSESWLLHELAKTGGRNTRIKDIFYAEVLGDGSLHVERYTGR